MYKYSDGQQFSDLAKKKNKDGMKFIMLDKLVPWRADQKDCIDASDGAHPVLLKLDGTPSNYHMLHFPYDATVNSNADFKAFYDVVKGSILLNFDKLSTARDFQETYDIMQSNGLLLQCIFKGKGIRNFSDVNNLFGGRNLSQMMFTPIFTKYDFTEEKDGILKSLISNDEKYNKAKACVDSMLLAEQQGKIKFPGCEIVYETTDTNDEFGWLASLASYVRNTLGKRVVQFSTNVENKQGAWSGNGNFWSELVGIDVNYWSWLYDNSATEDIRASVFVGDKPLEFRSYISEFKAFAGY